MADMRRVIERVPGLSEERLQVWVARGLVRPGRRGAEVVYREADVARLHLLVTLVDEAGLDAEAVPVVVELLDRIHGLRRALRLLGEAVEREPDDVRARIRAALAELAGEENC